MAELKDVLKSINKTKDLGVITKENESDYVPFIVNRCLSFFPDTALYANEMNMRPSLPRDMQFLFLATAINERSRFHPWLKKSISENIDLIRKGYGVSFKKALEIEPLLDEASINILKDSFNEGGAGNGR